MDRAAYTEYLRHMSPWSVVADPDQPHWLRRRLQRELRAEQRATVAELDRYRETDGSPYAGQETARYQDTRGWIGVDRYIHACLRRRRQTRRSPEPTPWGRLLADWTPERRCAHAFAIDAEGGIVHHDDPAAVRWCLGGWLAHLCQKPSTQIPHRRSIGEQWWDRSDDREARRLLGEVWALVPERTRQTTERIWKARTTPALRKRLDQHPLGYWWFLAPHLAERWLQIEPSAEHAPETRRS